MDYRIEFYNSSVQMTIEEWPPDINACFTRITAMMIKHGPNLGMLYTKAFGDGLFEIRAKGIDGIGRAFFCTLANKRIIILHGLIKKTQKTPVHELKIAKQRLKELERG